MTPTDLINAWNRCLDIIKEGVPAEQFNAWFAPIAPVSCVNNELHLSVPSEFFAERIEENYLMVLKPALREVFGSNISLMYDFLRVGQATSIESDNSSTDLKAELEKQKPQSGNPFVNNDIAADIDPQLNLHYNFENYCGSECNKLAITIGQAIANNPKDQTYNPLFIFGATGVGKTHLIQAIGIRIKEHDPHARVLYLTSKVFEDQYITAHLQNKTPDFINFYQSIDVLLLDDIHDLAGKKSTQNTFFHIFNYLQQHQRQLIMTSDCRPSELEGIVPRLLSRFKWGMTVQLEKPDYQLRKEVLQRRAKQDGLEIDNDVIDYIARNVTDSVRELEGVMVSLFAHATILNSDINIELAQRVISNSIKLNKRQLSIDFIAQVIADHYDMDADLLFGKSRKREISDARQLLMYLASTVGKMSSTKIGLHLERDHGTVLHGCKQIEQRLSIDSRFQSDVDKIIQKLKA